MTVAAQTLVAKKVAVAMIVLITAKLLAVPTNAVVKIATIIAVNWKI